jgi:hypothetical protein
MPTYTPTIKQKQRRKKKEERERECIPATFVPYMFLLVLNPHS